MREELILNNLGLIHKVMKDIHLNIRNEEEFNEYYYYGLVGLIKASNYFDPNKSKSSYLYKSIRREITDYIKQKVRYKRNPKKKDISLNTLLGDDAELQDFIKSDFNLEKYVIDKVFIDNELNKLKNKRYKAFLIEYYGINCPELNMQEIALKYGVSRQCVHQGIQLGLRLLRKGKDERKDKKNKIKIKNENRG